MVHTQSRVSFKSENCEEDRESESIYIKESNIPIQTHLQRLSVT